MYQTRSAQFIQVQPRAVGVPVFSHIIASGPAASVSPAPSLATLATTPNPVATVAPMLDAAISYSPQVANMRYIDPAFASQIVALRPALNGVPRTQIQAPICPNAEPTDTVLYTDPADPSKCYYLPRYALAQRTNTVGSPVYAIVFKADKSAFTLSVDLSAFAAPELGASAATATELTHTITVLLRAAQIVGGSAAAYDEYHFTDYVPISEGGNAGGIRATLHLATLGDRDAVYRALTDGSENASLIVRRAVHVAIPVPGGLTPVDPRPEIFLEAFYQPLSSMMKRIGEPPETDLPRRPPIPRPPIPRPPIPRPPRPLPPPEPLFREVDRALDATAAPAPFTFPPALYPYIYAGISAAGAANSALTPETVDYEGRAHSYLRRPATNKFYYLPDSFKLARRPDAPHAPMMALQLHVPDQLPDASADPLAGLTVTVQYIALPYTNPKRLADAAASLPLAGSDPAEFSPLMVNGDKLKLNLHLLNDASASNADAAPLVDLRSGISHSLTVAGKQFAAIYAALFGHDLLLLTGNVSVDLGGNVNVEPIPFEARMKDLIGAACDATLGLNDDGTLRVTLANAIESPVTISGVGLRDAGGTRACIASGVTFPFDLQPKAQATFSLAPATKVDDPALLSVVPDARVTPDPAAIYDAILASQAPVSFNEPIKVSASANTFVTGDNPVAKLVLDFPMSPSVELRADHLSDLAVVHPSVRDALLGAVVFLKYAYVLHVYRKTGDPERYERTDSTTDLIVTA